MVGVLDLENFTTDDQELKKMQELHAQHPSLCALEIRQMLNKQINKEFLRTLFSAADL